ncbi:MAG TPA: rod shape-determining protein MreD [Candidatus Dormibacteraeota bacterium]|nr:rod shape-determining protein MreD [Candidatus Dormibacteraeota bacterium]
MSDVDRPARWPSLTVAAAAAIVLQATWLHALTLRGGALDLVVIFVSWYAATAGAARGLIYGVLCGLAEDALALRTGAAHGLALALTGVVCGMGSRFVLPDSVLAIAGIVAIGTLVNAGVFWSAMSLGGYPAGLGTLHFHRALWGALLDTLVFLALWSAAAWLRNRQSTR